jgi:hypothetical protein
MLRRNLSLFAPPELELQRFQLMCLAWLAPHSFRYALANCGEAPMTNVDSNTTYGKAGTAAETKEIVFNEIRSRWGKFSEDDLSALKDSNDLVRQLAAKYGIENTQAQRDVDALLNGRRI